MPQLEAPLPLLNPYTRPSMPPPAPDSPLNNHALGLALLLAGCWLLWALFAARMRRNNPRLEPVTGLFLLFMRIYARVLHHLQVEGKEHIPASPNPGPLIVVANHTAGIDPVLVQVACPFEVKWLMARDMMVQGGSGKWAAAEELWAFTGVIPVDRTSARGDAAALRSALAYLKQGGVIGVFAEGAIARPRGTVLPFNPGVGLLAKRSGGGAPVLQVVITGTPDRPTAWGSLVRPSRARVKFLPMLRFDASTDPETIAQTLQARLIAETGWTLAGSS